MKSLYPSTADFFFLARGFSCSLCKAALIKHWDFTETSRGFAEILKTIRRGIYADHVIHNCVLKQMIECAFWAAAGFTPPALTIV